MISRLASALNLKFWPVVDMIVLSWFAKFWFGHLFSLYFTDQNVKSAKILNLQIGLVIFAKTYSWWMISRIWTISYEKKNGFMGIWYFADQSVKYTLTPSQNKGTTEAFELKFCPVIDLDYTRWCAKFQVNPSRGWYFTDRSVFYLNCSLCTTICPI